VTVECLAIFVAFLFLVIVKYLYSGTALEKVKWDLATVTAGDYTMEWKFNPEDYKKWEARKPQGVPEALAFKQDVEKEIIKALNAKQTELTKKLTELTEKKKNGPRDADLKKKAKRLKKTVKEFEALSKKGLKIADI